MCPNILALLTARVQEHFVTVDFKRLDSFASFSLVLTQHLIENDLLLCSQIILILRLRKLQQFLS